MLNLDPKQSKIFLFLITLIVILVGYNFYREFIAGESVIQIERSEELTFPPERSDTEAGRKGIHIEQNDWNQETIVNDTIKVYIAGQVLNPGVYEVTNGSRLSEVVDLAGGLMEDADLLRVNLAIRVEDEMMYIVPKVGEELPIIETNRGSELNETSASSKININTADSALLESLPGIGPSRARAIIEYRENHGLFRTIDGIKDVSGIGDKIFEGLKDYIDVK